MSARKHKRIQLRDESESEEDSGAGSGKDSEDDGLITDELRDLQRTVAQYGADMYGDDADRARLLAMPELEREMELSERWEQKEELDERMKVVDLARSERRAKRPKNPTKLSKEKQALDTIKRKRQKALKADSGSDSASEENARPSKPSKPAAPPPRAPSPQAKANDDGDDDDDGEAFELPVEERPTLQDLLPLQLTRKDLEKWVNEIFFAETVTGLFVRLSEKPNNRFSHQMKYRIVEISEVYEGEVYQLGQTTTCRWLRVQSGKYKSNTNMRFISNKPFTQEEFDRWVWAGKKAKIAPVSKSYILSRRNFRSNADNFVYTDELISKVIKYKQSLMERSNKLGVSAMRRLELEEKIELAREDGDVEAVGRLNDELEKFEKKERELRERQEEKEIAIEAINERKRKRDILEAQAAKHQIRETKADAMDPFVRRRTHASFVMEEESPKQKRQDAPKVEPQSPDESPLLAAASKRMRSLEQAKALQRIDFDLDLDGDAPLPPLSLNPGSAPPEKPKASNPTPSSANGSGNGSNKRLSLSDYLKRKGA